MLRSRVLNTLCCLHSVHALTRLLEESAERDSILYAGGTRCGCPIRLCKCCNNLSWACCQSAVPLEGRRVHAVRSLGLQRLDRYRDLTSRSKQKTLHITQLRRVAALPPTTASFGACLVVRTKVTRSRVLGRSQSPLVKRKALRGLPRSDLLHRDERTFSRSDLRIRLYQRMLLFC